MTKCKTRRTQSNRRFATRRAALVALFIAAAIEGPCPAPSALAAGYPRVPLVYDNLLRVASALMAEMTEATRKDCLDSEEKEYFDQRVRRLEQEIDQQLTRPDAGEFFTGYPSRPTPNVNLPPPSAGGGMEALPMSGAALGSSPRYELTNAKDALDQEMSIVEGRPDCVPDVGPTPADGYMMAPPPQGPSFGVGGVLFGWGKRPSWSGDSYGGQDFNKGKR